MIESGFHEFFAEFSDFGHMCLRPFINLHSPVSTSPIKGNWFYLLHRANRRSKSCDLHAPMWVGSKSAQSMWSGWGCLRRTWLRNQTWGLGV